MKFFEWMTVPNSEGQRYPSRPASRVAGGDVDLTPQPHELDPVIWIPPLWARGAVRWLGWAATAAVILYIGGLWARVAWGVGEALAMAARAAQ